MIDKRKSDKLDFITIEKFCSVKDSVKRMRRQVIDWKKIFSNDISSKDNLEYIQNFQNSTGKQINPIRKWAKDMKRHFTRVNMQMTNKTSKDVQQHCH